MKRSATRFRQGGTAVIILTWFSMLGGSQTLHGLDTCEPHLFAGTGSYEFPITTEEPMAQRFFNQGMVLAYGFNHAEAERSFRHAARIDPNCAMCYWGAAFVLGPNINKPMDESAQSAALAYIAKAVELAPLASALEQDLIAAMRQRYSADPQQTRAALDRAFADAMAKVASQHPSNSEASVIYAEALMDLMPWDYWAEKGLKPDASKALAALTSVLARDPNHIGANHLYIHLVEAVRPEWGESAADRLRGQVPMSGHLTHMPSHIYIRLGRYHDASTVNQQAIAADLSYLQQCHAKGFYLDMYIPHNMEFLVATASLEGRSELAIRTADQIRAYLARGMDHTHADVTAQHFYSLPSLTRLRFNQWEKVLAEPRPQSGWTYAQGVWRYSRAVALAQLGRIEEAERESSLLDRLMSHHSLEGTTIMGLNSARKILTIGAWEAKGIIAAAKGDFAAAKRYLNAAIQSQDALIYIEPPAWYRPARWVLGQVLLKAEEPKAAERAFREDLQHFPNNGWSLAGLKESLMAQNRLKEADGVQLQLDQAWKHADIQLTPSVLLPRD